MGKKKINAPVVRAADVVVNKTTFNLRKTLLIFIQKNWERESRRPKELRHTHACTEQKILFIASSSAHGAQNRKYETS